MKTLSLEHRKAISDYVTRIFCHYDICRKTGSSPQYLRQLEKEYDLIYNISSKMWHAKQNNCKFVELTDEEYEIAQRIIGEVK